MANAKEVQYNSTPILVEYAKKDGSGNVISSTYAKSGDLSEVATSGDYDDLSNKPTIPSAVTSIDGLSGGQLTSAIYLAGGDAVSGIANIQLDTDGQITAKGTTSTLLGRTNNGGDLLVGHSSHNLLLRGNQTRPTYNGNNMAMYSDLPNAVSGIHDGTNWTSITIGTTSKYIPTQKKLYRHSIYFMGTTGGAFCQGGLTIYSTTSSSAISSLAGLLSVLNGTIYGGAYFTTGGVTYSVYHLYGVDSGSSLTIGCASSSTTTSSFQITAMSYVSDTVTEI